jgi:hypothetical protein
LGAVFFFLGAAFFFGAAAFFLGAVSFLGAAAFFLGDDLLLGAAFCKLKVEEMLIIMYKDISIISNDMTYLGSDLFGGRGL